MLVVMRISEEKRIELKELYPKTPLKVATVSVNEETHDFVFKPLDRVTIDQSAKATSNSPTQAVEIEMVNSLVFGDKTLLETDDTVFIALMKKWNDIQKNNTATVTLGEL
jgi:hypothetical protein